MRPDRTSSTRTLSRTGTARATTIVATAAANSSSSGIDITMSSGASTAAVDEAPVARLPTVAFQVKSDGTGGGCEAARGAKVHVNAVAFSPDGRRLAAASGDGNCYVYNLYDSGGSGGDGGDEKGGKGGREKRGGGAGGGGGGRKGSRADDQDSEMVGRGGGGAALSSLARRLKRALVGPKVVRVVMRQGHDDEILSVAWSLDGKLLVTGGRDNGEREGEEKGEGEREIEGGGREGLTLAAVLAIIPSVSLAMAVAVTLAVTTL
jgi:WD40 repeat protein